MKKSLWRKLWLSAVALFGVSGVASANDWAGPYVGGGLGWADGEGDSTVTLKDNWTSEALPFRTAVTNLWNTSLNPAGAIFTGHAGFNVNSGGFIWGGEVMVDAGRLNDDRASGPTVIAPQTYSVTNSVDVDTIVTARLRGGFLMGDTLLYGAIGYATADVTTEATIQSVAGYSKAGKNEEWAGGIAIGAGFEMPLADKWTVRGEYQRIEIDEVTFNTVYRPGSTFVTVPPYTESFKQDVNLDTVKISVSYHF